MVFIALMAVIFPAWASPLILKDQTSYDLTGHLELLRDPSNRLTIQQVSQRTDWMGTRPGKVPNLGLTHAAIWLRCFVVNRADTPKTFYLSLEYPVINAVSFYIHTSSQVFREERAGSTTPASTGVLSSRFFLFPFTLNPDQSAEIYVRTTSTSSLTLPVRILSDQGLISQASRDYLLYGLLLGLLVLVMLYFTTVGSFLYKGAPIWLALYSVFFGLHAAIRGGFIRLLLPDSALWLIGLFQIVAISGLFFTGAKFFRLFLDLNKHSRLLDRVMVFFQYLGLAFLMMPLFPSPVKISLTFILIVVNPLFSITVACYFWRKGVPNAGYFAVGWAVAHAAAVYDFFRIHGLFPYQPFGEWSIPFSLFFTLLFLSIALIRQNAADHLMAETDPLTQLANRRKLDESLHQEWDRCQRLQSPLAVIMADVDHFKQYNDAFGHRAGDHCLRRIAEILSRHTRRTGDLAARYGGEEFTLLLPHLDAGNAFSLAESIRHAVGKLFEGGTTRHPAHAITISLGVASDIPADGKTPEDLLLRADRAMYEAKRAGRNQTVISKTAAV